ncbi:MAG TPA: hypothetical protein VGC77_04690 [Rhodopseudomonas sp.]|uniref:hypothetical protein n=1 Tax=Rhodopseudomonas sp. TaxID=1078 RepID=UPI002ED77CB9
MVESLPSEPAEPASRGAGHPTKRLLVAAMAALLIVGGAVAWRITASPVAAPVAKLAPPPKNPQLDELIDSTKALGVSQQEAIDQLQEVQDLLRAQQAETKRASDRVAALSAKLDALQQSFASAPPPAAEAAVAEQAEPPRAHAGKAQRSRAAHRPRGKRSRGAARR